MHNLLFMVSGVRKAALKWFCSNNDSRQEYDCHLLCWSVNHLCLELRSTRAVCNVSNGKFDLSPIESNICFFPAIKPIWKNVIWWDFLWLLIDMRWLLETLAVPLLAVVSKFCRCSLNFCFLKIAASEMCDRSGFGLKNVLVQKISHCYATLFFLMSNRKDKWLCNCHGGGFSLFAFSA